VQAFSVGSLLRSALHVQQYATKFGIGTQMASTHEHLCTMTTTMRCHCSIILAARQSATSAWYHSINVIISPAPSPPPPETSSVLYLLPDSC
jgi:hypothetical protein